jgi:uncharacterized protein
MIQLASHQMHPGKGLSLGQELYSQGFRLSAYVHHHRVSNGVVGLYVPFNHQVTFVPEAAWNALQTSSLNDLHPQFLQDLVGRRFLATENADATALEQLAVPSMAGFVSLWLLIVKTCNMGCRYCVVDAEGQTQQIAADRRAGLSADPTEAAATAALARMTPEIASAGIAMFQRSLARHRAPMAKATLYGGEPMLNRPLLRHAIPELRAMHWQGQQHPLQIVCFTNGLIYDESITELFKQYQVNVGLSLDGTRQHHDAARPRLDGSSTFERVVESYRRYRESGINVGISCTIGKHNKDDLPEIARYLVEQLGAPSVQFQTPIQSPENNNPLYVDMHDAAESAWTAFKTLRDFGIEEGLAMRRISRFVANQFHHRDCFAVGGELVVSPDGTLGPCHNATIGADEYFTGNVLDEQLDPECQPNFMEWHARMPINMPGCHGCPAISLCGGGCPYNAYLTKGSIWDKDPHQCGYLAKFLDQLLEDIWQRYDGTLAQMSQAGRVAPGAQSG